jgi:hypothetical protein
MRTIAVLATTLFAVSCTEVPNLRLPPIELSGDDGLCPQYEIALRPVVGLHGGDFIERLSNPVLVAGTLDGDLVLEDGRRVALRGIRRVSHDCAELLEATRLGVELKHGCVYGLVRVWHWCGVDDVRAHVARVDLAEYLRFRSEVGVAGSFCWDGKLDFAEFGAFVRWQEERLRAYGR